MATIGLDKLYYAPITENANGEETYGTPVQLAKAISADLSVELAEATLYADDGASEVVKEFKSGTLSLGVDDIGASVAAALTGVTIDRNKVIISTSEGKTRQRQVQVFLALPRKVRHSGNEPRHKGRQHYLQYSDH